jgi:hypothetical protein
MVNKKKTQNKLVQVIIPVNHPNPPEPHEVDAAMVLARHYQSSVEFVIPINDYKRKNADFVLLGIEWELKCPIGVSKATIENQFRTASKQSKNLVIDTRRTKLEYEIIVKRVLFEIKKRPYMRKVILIDKQKKVVEIKG